MSKSTSRRRPARPRVEDATAGSADARLARLLESPRLPEIVSRLPAEALHQVLQRRGLADCGVLIAAATPRQVASVLDLDLWQAPGGGRDEQFDRRRFGQWIETLMEEGEEVAVRVVAGMERHLAILGLAGHVRVFDAAALSPVQTEDAIDEGGVTPGAGGADEREIGGYIVRARTADAWDALVELLVALEAADADCFHALMGGCRRLSHSTPEVDGLDALLPEPEQLRHDVSIGRDARRRRLGYLTPADARAYLEMTRQRRSGSPRPGSTGAMNPIAAGYFAGLTALDQPEVASRGERAEPSGPPAETPADDVSEAAAALVALIQDVQPGAGPPRARLGSGSGNAAEGAIEGLLAPVREADPVAFAARERELAFLTNTLVAGCSVLSRALTVQEASAAALGFCNLGLELWSSEQEGGLVQAFEAGWAFCHREVSLVVARRLIEALEAVGSVDPAVQDDLDRLRRAMTRALSDGAPWRAAGALEAIGLIDMPSWACLNGLLSECPVLPTAVTAVLERRSRSISPTAFDPFATLAQVRQAQAFSAGLTGILVR